MATLQFELVSPEKLLLSEQVGMVVVPGSEGNFGVLPGHALFISTVRPGVIDVYEEGASTPSERIFIAGGFAEVTADRCTVLADEAIPVSALDRGAIEAQARAHEGTIAGLRDQIARAGAEDHDRLAEQLMIAEHGLGTAQAKLAVL